MLNVIGVEAFEASLRKRLNERRKQLDMTFAAFGKLAFPYVMDVNRKGCVFLSTDRHDVQQMRAAELLNACEALGLDWQAEMGKALADAEACQEEARLGEIRKRQARRQAESGRTPERDGGKRLGPSTRPRAGGGADRGKKGEAD